MYGRFGRGAGRGGGLYSNFVSSSDSSKPYRGAEIPPPASLNSSKTEAPVRATGSGTSSAGAGAFAPPASYHSSRSESQRKFDNPTPGVSKHGYTTISAIQAHNLSYAQYGVPIKRQKTEEEYFNENDDEDYAESGVYSKSTDTSSSSLPYQPAPGSPSGHDVDETAKKKDDSDSEEDTLDAFMADLEKTVKQKGLKKMEKVAEKQSAKNTKEMKGIRDDIEAEDDEESYYKWLEENPNAGKNLDEDEVVEYDEEGNPIFPNRRYIDPLPPINHNEIEYDAFEKNFYNEHPDIAGLSIVQVLDLQQKLGVHVSGAVPPKPVTSFAHFGFDENLMKAIRRSEFTQPTPIQAQGIPAILSGRDVIGIAKTGSGKTAAFLWPMLVHIMDQGRLLKGDGPIGLVLAPTRELAMQIYAEAKKFGKVYDIQVVCAYGGGSKWEQSKAFEAGAEIAIATPGRMIDMIKMKVTNLQRVTYLVLDEADKMFNMGFEPQVRSICDHVRPDRQCMLFSATFKKKIERLARDVLIDPIKIVQGNIGEASEDVHQIVKVVELGGVKWNWLLSHLVEFMSAGSVLIFVTKKQNCEELATNLKLKEFDCRCIHGDLNQHERNEIIHAFKKQEFPVLVATDVAARGLDIPHIRTVINFDVARDIDTHTHRVGRTGRAGVKGTAYTLVTEKDKEFAGHIVRNLESANQEVPTDLMDLAMKSAWFKNSRFKRGRGKGFGSTKERPGLGSSDLTSSSSSSAISGRLATKKMAFKNSYLSNFCRASEQEGVLGEGGVTKSVQEQLMPPPPPVMMPPSAPSATSSPSEGDKTARKRKSRWE